MVGRNFLSNPNPVPEHPFPSENIKEENVIPRNLKNIPEITETSGSEITTEIYSLNEISKKSSESEISSNRSETQTFYKNRSFFHSPEIGDFSEFHSNFHPQISENSFVNIEVPEIPEIPNQPDIEVSINSINNTSAEITEKVEILPETISNIQISIEITKSGTINVITDVPFNSHIFRNLEKSKSDTRVEELDSLTEAELDEFSSKISSIIEIPKSSIDQLILIINEKIPKCRKILMAECQLRELFLENKLFENGVEAILSLINNEEIGNDENFENAINCIKSILKIYVNLGLTSAAHIANELNNRILANHIEDSNSNCIEIK